MPHLIRLFVALGVSLAAVALHPQKASGEEIIQARALGGPPSRELVAYVAGAAVAQTFEAGSRPDLEPLTARQLIRLKCGSVPQGYLELASASEVADTPLGSRLYSIQWPACLHATSLADGATAYQVRPKDNIGSIWQQFTGSGITTPEVRAAVTKASTLARGDVLDLMPGDLVVVPATISTAITVKTDRKTFEAGLKALGLSGQIKIFVPEDHGGEILVPVFEGPVGQVANAGKSCVASANPPFDPSLTAAAFAFTRRISYVSPVKAIIVDNGFFGVRCDAAGCPPAADPYVDNFPRRYFTLGPDWALRDIGPRLLSGLEPVNYYNRGASGLIFAPKDINADSGHGTHVAGLMLGGPAFAPYRWVFNLNSADTDDKGLSWLKLVVLNVAGGSRDIQADAYNGVITTVNGIPDRKVVNMSLMFSSSQPDFEKKLRNQITGQSGVLFVVAAGNAGDDLENLAALPARLSARDNNVLTVASIDGDGRISEFSNWSTSYADIAAPGCQIGSWLDGRPAALAGASGTSQSAPLVAFTAVQLRALWDEEPLMLKNRIGVSGDLIDCEPRENGERPCVAFQTMLNPWKALLIDTDVVTLETKEGRSIWLGRFQSNAAVRCGSKLRAWSTIKSIKRRKDGAIEVYWSPTGSGPVQRCTGRLDHPTPQTGALLDTTHKVELSLQAPKDGASPVDQPGAISDAVGTDIPIDLSQLKEVVFRSRQ